MFGLYKAGAMEEIDCTFVQLLVFSALIVAVDPVAVRTDLDTFSASNFRSGK